jgi:hypothetical protein
MAQPQVATLRGARDETGVRRARTGRRIGLGVLAVVVAAGLSGFLGIRSATVTGESDGYRLAVTHAQVTRAGIAVPFHVRVTHTGGFDGPLTLAISEGLLERFDFQNFYPNPSAETGTPGYVYYEFDPPPGDVFELNLDARTAPDQNGSTTVYRTALIVGGDEVTDVSFRVWVVP